MEPINIAEQPTPSQVTRTHTLPVRALVALFLAIALGAWTVRELRQEGAKGQPLLWIPLLVIMFGAAMALRQMDLWLPGQPILPRLARVSAQTPTLLGALCIALSPACTWFIVQRLLPDYRNLWHGLPLLWLISMLLVVTGAALLGAVGRASPRAATASTLWQESSLTRWLEAAAFLLILALAIFLRTYRLNSIPPGIYVDETNGGLDALYILEGRDVSPFATGWYGTPNGYLYYMAGLFKLLGANWISLKIASLIPAILTVIAIYFLGRLIFGPGVGLSAMLLLAASRWHLTMSRWGWNETAPPLFQILATFFLIRGLRDRRALDYALGGLLTGLSIYTYLSARLAAATLLLYILLWILFDPSGVRLSLRRSWLGLVLFLLAAWVAVAPLAVTYSKEPFAMNNRVAEISILRDVHEQGSVKPFLQNIADVLKFFHQTGDHQGKHNLPDEPMTDPITGLFFAIGLAYSLLRWRDQRYQLLLLWLVIGLSGSFLSSHHESPQSYRALTALPAVVLMAAEALDRVTRAIYRAVKDGASSQSPSRRPAVIAGAIAILALAGATAWESNVYFGRQANSTAVERGFNPVENRVAREVITALQANQTVYLSPSFSEYSPLRFLVYGVIKARTGANTLDDRPYQTLLPESDLPLPDTGQDALILLDSNYWPLREYFKSFYPQASMQLNSLSDGSPLYFKIEIPQKQLAEVQGLTETVTYSDGRVDRHPAVQIELKPNEPASEIHWAGSLRIAHGGDYELQGQGGLDILIDGLPVTHKQYFGRGLYGLEVIWKAGDSATPYLLWRMLDHDWTAVPQTALFRTQGRRQGLLATYWNNMNWEDAPVFHQITPFLLLAWNQEQPIVPNGPFSARYTGLLNITEAGTYTFKVEADDGARLIVDGTVLGEGLVAGQPNQFEASVDLALGNHPIQMDYFQQGGGTALRLYWRRGDQPFTPVPPSALIPAQP